MSADQRLAALGVAIEMHRLNRPARLCGQSIAIAGPAIEVFTMTTQLPRCPECNAGHDPRPCAREQAMCSCCRAIFADAAQRDAACRALNGGR
jgi:hypothetical protein